MFCPPLLVDPESAPLDDPELVEDPELPPKKPLDEEIVLSPPESELCPELLDCTPLLPAPLEADPPCEEAASGLQSHEPSEPPMESQT